MDDLKIIQLALSNIAEKSVKEYIVGEKLETDALYYINRVSGNPLYIFNLARGFYSTLVSLLSLYNPYTFFISIIRSIPRKLFLKFFPSFDIDILRRFGISFDTVNVCQDVNHMLYAYNRDSIPNNIPFFTNIVYRLIKKSRNRSLSRYLKLVDEEDEFIRNAEPPRNHCFERKS